MKIDKYLTDDTIAAVITAVGGSVSIIRISGGNALPILKKLFLIGNTKRQRTNFESHRVYYGKIANMGEVVDEVLATVMLAPKTYTREDVVEISCHGGESVEAVFRLILKNGARQAEPGEFTKRAFLNGRIDLAQAEAVSDLITAKTALTRKTSLNRLEGKLSRRVKAYADKILSLMAQIEAVLDYPEHDELGLTSASVAAGVRELITSVESLVKTFDAGRIIQDGVNTVIMGKPNAGKSSLLNALVGGERAIVTDIAGTTRDILKEYIMLEGVPLKISDTAGIRKTDDIIEKIGVERTKQEAANADLILLTLDGTQNSCDMDCQLLDEIEILMANGVKVITLINKVDITSENDKNILYKLLDERRIENIIEISAKQLIGLDLLAERIKQIFLVGGIDYENSELICTVRHKTALCETLAHLQNALSAAESGLSEEFISIDLQSAYYCIGEITGESMSEDLIDKIFSEFCLGK